MAFKKRYFALSGLCPKPHFIFWLKPKNEAKNTSPVLRTPSPFGEGKRKKVFDCARFTRKTYAQLAETVQTRSFVAQTGQFQTPTSLVFRFTERGQSLRLIDSLQLYSSRIIIKNDEAVSK